MNSTDLKNLIIDKIDRLKRKGFGVGLTVRKENARNGTVFIEIDHIRLLKEVTEGSSKYKIFVNNENITINLGDKDLERIYSIMSQGLETVEFEEVPDLLTYLKN